MIYRFPIMSITGGQATGYQHLAAQCAQTMGATADIAFIGGFSSGANGQGLSGSGANAELQMASGPGRRDPVCGGI